MSGTRVVAVTAGASNLIREIVSLLERGGMAHVEVDRPDQVPAELRADGGNAVLIHSALGKRTANALVETLREKWSDVPVVVLVDSADVDEFYELMCAGAYDYFETGEGAQVIAEALRWAAHTRALPPRTLAKRSRGADASQETAACAAV